MGDGHDFDKDEEVLLRFIIPNLKSKGVFNPKISKSRLQTKTLKAK